MDIPGGVVGESESSGGGERTSFAHARTSEGHARSAFGHVRSPFARPRSSFAHERASGVPFRSAFAHGRSWFGEARSSGGCARDSGGLGRKELEQVRGPAGSPYPPCMAGGGEMYSRIGNSFPLRNLAPGGRVLRMNKPADSSLPILQVIRERWSPRAFSDRPIEESTLEVLLEAARWAPSCFNEQPWSYIVATKDNPEEFQRLLSCLVPANQVWAKNAPVLMLSVASLNFQRNSKPNSTAIHDVGLASENLELQAQAMGVSVHQMAGFDDEAAIKAYGIPQGYVPVAAIALGYPGDPNSLPEDLRTRELAPRERKSLSSFVFGGKWANPAPFLKGYMRRTAGRGGRSSR